MRDQEEREDHEQRHDLDEQCRVEEEVEDKDDGADHECRLEPEAPEPDAAPGDHVLLAELPALQPEQARSGNHPVEEQVDQTAEADDDEERREDRPEPGPALGLVQPDDDGRGGEQRDGRRRARQPAPLAGQLVRALGLLKDTHGLGFVATFEV